MKIVKESQGGAPAAVTGEDLALINARARKEPEAGEVYTFSVRLCDVEVDRDFERFAPQTLEGLAGLFVGKSGIFDHQWSARGQAARIYKTEVVREPEKLTRAGDGYCWLKGYAYMLRTDSAKDLIAEIEGGIKKEVSVGCAVERSERASAGTKRARSTTESCATPVWREPATPMSSPLWRCPPSPPPEWSRVWAGDTPA